MNVDKLDLWMNQLVRYVRSGSPDLTNRQMALVLLVCQTDGPHTVRGTAKVMEVTKPVVTRALNTLCHLGLLRRERDMDDRRSVFIRSTTGAKDFLNDLAATADQSGTDSNSKVPTGRKLGV
jgi:DNA-binding MarR family transcriptional regulator